MPIIFDDFVDMKFGTGAVKITPAHSKIDYEVAKRHHLPLLQVINEEGNMENVENFKDYQRYECREMLVSQISELGMLKSIKPHAMTLPICSRSGDVIEHLPKEQWFLSCRDLSKKAANLVKNNELKIQPDRFVKHWLDWSNDDRDWCISRQLWWGHQIPAYKCSVNKDIIWIAADDEASAKIEASKYLRVVPEEITAERDADVLDTWFSSGIYPFASLGWPEYHHNDDYKEYYPLSLMATGHDIFGLWVQRMVMLGLELTGRLPFKNVLLHGIICDNKGAKMSKSRGNVIDPIDVINGISIEKLKVKSEEMYSNGILNKEELKKALTYHKANFASTKGIPECGVDALRFTLLSQDIQSHFVNFDVALCHANKLFCNKIWQSIKYTQMAYAKLKPYEENITKNDLTVFDRWILSRLADMVEKVNETMDTYDFHIATKAIRTLIYNEFCDTYLEATKPGFEDQDLKIGYCHAHTLSAVLNTSLRCLAPFMVYLTDELIPKIPALENNIIFNFNDDSMPYFDFPKAEEFKIWKDEQLENQVDKLLNFVYLTRELKGLYDVSNKFWPTIRVNSVNGDIISDIERHKNIVLNLTRCSNVEFGDISASNKYAKGILDRDTEIGIEILAEDIDSAKVSARTKLEKRIKKLEDSLVKLEAKFTNSNCLTTSEEWSKVSDQEKLIIKKRELEELQRLI